MSQQEIEILFIGPDTAASDRPRAFERVPQGDQLQRVSTVDEARAYLVGLQNGREGSSVPAMVLVSSTVESSGTSTLVSWMRCEPTLKNIPVVVLTSVPNGCSCSNPREDVSDAYFVRVSDTDALLNIVSEHLPGSSTGHPLRHASFP